MSTKDEEKKHIDTGGGTSIDKELIKALIKKRVAEFGPNDYRVHLLKNYLATEGGRILPRLSPKANRCWSTRSDLNCFRRPNVVLKRGLANVRF